MPRPERSDRSDDDLDEDRDLPLESDMDDDDVDAPVDPCPYCQNPVYEDAEWCHHCGRYLSEEDAPERPIPAWVILGAAAVMIIVAFWMLGRP